MVRGLWSIRSAVRATCWRKQANNNVQLSKNFQTMRCIASLAPNGAQTMHQNDSDAAISKWMKRLIAGSALGMTLAFCTSTNNNSTNCEDPAQADAMARINAGERREGLPEYSLDEVQAHGNPNDLTNGVWLVYKSGVYDITKFAKSHPGGTKIFLAAGKSIEPFWQLYAAHNHADVHRILETLRIGNLREEDVLELERIRQEKHGNGPYSNDPARHPALQINSSQPFNAEPPNELLIQSFITPNELFFVRNHLPVPQVDAEAFRLTLSGLGVKEEVSLSLEDLKTKFKHRKVVTTIQCAGNRRAEMAKVKQVNGLSWDTNALSTAEWTGVSLYDVLKSLGVDEQLCDEGIELSEQEEAAHDKQRIRHVQFEGLDTDEEGNCYGASIPIATALDPRADVLLAFEMNDQPIPRDHGFPLRLIVPGTVGARNVKYMHRIVLAHEESRSFWQRRDYKGFSPSVDFNTENLWQKASPSIQELPVQSAILEPRDGSVWRTELDEDGAILTAKGYAWSGGGRNIIRVDVSSDGGKTWQTAQLDEQATKQKYNRAWAWTPWEIDLDVPHGTTELELVCKAVDSSYNVQPDTIDPIWNLRGLLNNAWHRIKIQVVEEEEEEEEEEENEEEELRKS